MAVSRSEEYFYMNDTDSLPPCPQIQNQLTFLLLLLEIATFAILIVS